MAIAWNDLMPVDDPAHDLNGADQEALEEIRDVLERRGLLSRFGVTLLHKHFDLRPGERLIESTDSFARTQRISVMTDVEIGGREVLETAWRLNPEGSQPMMGCIMGCFGKNLEECEYREHTGEEN